MRTAPPLEEFLGRARPWIDLFMKQGGGYPGENAGRTQVQLPRQLEDPAREHDRRLPLPDSAQELFDSSLDGDTEELFSFMDAGGYVEDLGNGHSVMVMIPELVDLEENLDEPIPETICRTGRGIAQGSQ